MQPNKLKKINPLIRMRMPNTPVGRGITLKVTLLLIMFAAITGKAANYKREITVAQDGSGDFTTITESLEAIRAFMDYKVTVNIRNGVYREKIIIPSWIQNVDFIGENADSTIITWADHANIDNMGTFRTFTVRVDGNNLRFRNLTIENNAEPLGQAVALHTEGDRLAFFNCRFLGNQDTIFTGAPYSRLYFCDCLIEGTTDFIFGGATALFDGCEIYSRRDSYITAASTPEDSPAGYVFYNCRLTAAPGVSKVYLGRPWRPYAATVFIDCEMGAHIVPEGWDNWRDPANEQTARYGEYGSTGPGGDTSKRVEWAKRLTDDDVKGFVPLRIFNHCGNWVME